MLGTLLFYDAPAGYAEYHGYDGQDRPQETTRFDQPVAADGVLRLT